MFSQTDNNNKNNNNNATKTRTYPLDFDQVDFDQIYYNNQPHQPYEPFSILQTQTNSKNVYIELSSTEQFNYLGEAFSKFGKINKITHLTNKNSIYGVAFVNFCEVESVEKALLLNGTLLCGQPLKVERSIYIRKDGDGYHNQRGGHHSNNLSPSSPHHYQYGGQQLNSSPSSFRNKQQQQQTKVIQEQIQNAQYEAQHQYHSNEKYQNVQPPTSDNSEYDHYMYYKQCPIASSNLYFGDYAGNIPMPEKEE